MMKYPFTTLIDLSPPNLIVIISKSKSLNIFYPAYDRLPSILLMQIYSILTIAFDIYFYALLFNTK